MRSFVRSLTRYGLLAAGVSVASVALAGSHDMTEGGSQSPSQTGAALPIDIQAQDQAEPMARAGTTSHEQAQPAGKVARGGMLALALAALGDVELRPEQRAPVSALVEEAIIRNRALVAAHDGLMQSMADQLEAGGLDRDVLSEKAEAVSDAWTCVRSADLAALETLHGMLDEQQRASFADAFEEQMDAHVHAHESGAWLDELSREVGLTDEQRNTLQAKLCELRYEGGAREAMEGKRQRFSEMLDAFRGEDFGAARFAPGEEAEDEAEERTERMLDFAEEVVGVMSPEQRARTARLIREKSAERIAGAEPGGAADEQGGEPQQAAPTGQGTEEEIGTADQELLAGGFGRGYGTGYGMAYGYQYPIGGSYGVPYRGYYGRPYGAYRGMPYGGTYYGGLPYGAYGSTGYQSSSSYYQSTQAASHYQAAYSTGYPFGLGW